MLIRKTWLYGRGKKNREDIHICLRLDTQFHSLASIYIINHSLIDMAIIAVPSQPPEAVTAYAMSSQSITITWSPPQFYTLHGVLQGYKVLFKPDRSDEGL